MWLMDGTYDAGFGDFYVIFGTQICSRSTYLYHFPLLIFIHASAEHMSTQSYNN